VQLAHHRSEPPIDNLVKAEIDVAYRSINKADSRNINLVWSIHDFGGEPRHAGQARIQRIEDTYMVHRAGLTSPGASGIQREVLNDLIASGNPETALRRAKLLLPTPRVLLLLRLSST
jgi:hypothetical protein